MVVELTVPMTRTWVPFLMALAEIELDPLLYFVEELSSTVTFCPAEVVRVKPELDTLVTVPEDPPAAGPDRALDPPAAAPGGPAVWLLDAAGVAAAAGDARRPTESPIMGASIAAATMRRHFFFVNRRRTFGLRSHWAEVTSSDHSGEDVEWAGAAVAASTEPLAIDGSDVVLAAEGSESVAWGVVGS
jgi:hypothetical protein